MSKEIYVIDGLNFREKGRNIETPELVTNGLIRYTLGFQLIKALAAPFDYKGFTFKACFLT
jgi:hypothetical protein